MTTTILDGLDWQAELVSVTDGDTLRVHLRRRVAIVNGWRMVLEDDDDEDGVPIRLVIVNTPEKRDDRAAWAHAREDLLLWVEEHVHKLRVETYESGGWDRLLGDLYVAGDRGNTATQHLLRLGWPIYKARGREALDVGTV